MINIFGVVGEDVRASDILQQIQAEGGDSIEVVIMSPGGSVIEGLAIYDALRATGKTIITKAMGQAASIASIIFMAGDVREVADNAEIMIHNAWGVVAGNKHQLGEAMERMNEIDNRLINVYVDRAGMPAEDVRAMLDDETFMSADEAISKGFATDKINAMALVAMYNKKEEPINMADDKQAEEISEKEQGLFARFTAWLKNENPTEEVETEETAKEIAEDVTETVSKEEYDALRVELDLLKSAESDRLEAEALSLAEEKAEDAEQQDKNTLLFQAMQDNKILLADAIKLSKKPLDEVVSFVAELGKNATKRGNAGEPEGEVTNSMYEEYQTLQGADRVAFFNENREEIIKQAKES